MNEATQEKVSGRQMCELISEYFREYGGIDRTPEQIWNYSPSGELFMVFAWYEEAVIWKQIVALKRAIAELDAAREAGI